MDAAQRPKWLLPVLLVLTIEGAIGFVPGAWLMAMSWLLFSDLAADERPFRLLLILAMIWAVPLLALLGLVLGWIGLFRRRYALAREGVLLAVVPVTAEVGATALAMHIFGYL